MAVKKTLAARIRTAIEWLRCPSNRAIRRKVVFQEQKDMFELSLERINHRADFVLSRPRHQRRILLKLMERDGSFHYLQPYMISAILEFLE